MVEAKNGEPNVAGVRGRLEVVSFVYKQHDRKVFWQAEVRVEIYMRLCEVVKFTDMHRIERRKRVESTSVQRTVETAPLDYDSRRKGRHKSG